MPTTRSPRHGSMQVWPRKRAKRAYARVRAWPESQKAVPLGFAGYKAGMTHVTIIENRKTKKSKGQELTFPVTVVECPPLKIASARFYKNDSYGSHVITEIVAKADKELDKKVRTPKKIDEKALDAINPSEYDNITINVYTQPKLTAIGKKKPELFELALGGTNEEKLKYIKENFGKEIFINNVLSEGAQIDIHAITKGKGFQGPVKRFGIGLRAAKSEKTKRGPGSLGGWKAQGHFMYRIAHAGQMGYHQRVDYNKWLVKISDKIEEINPKGGFINFGFVKNPYILIKGSIPGPKKRLIRFNPSTRSSKKIPKDKPTITYVSLESKQR